MLKLSQKVSLMDLLKLITPTNLSEEESKFFQSNHYHPVFKYDWNQEVINTWNALNPKYFTFSQAVINQDYLTLVRAGESLFQTVWDEAINLQALELVKNKPQILKNPTLEELINYHKQRLTQLGINYQLEVVDSSGFIARPNHHQKKLFISRHFNFSYFSLAGSVRHDLVHLIRYLNGQHSHVKRSAHYLPTEEGLATFMQDHGGAELNYSFFQHAAEYVVTKTCLEGSLRDAVTHLISLGFPQKLAWQRAVRHKFGFIDSSRPGDIMKPAMYFAHSQKIGQLSPANRLKLFMGKIALNELDSFPEYQGLWTREQLNQIFNQI